QWDQQMRAELAGKAALRRRALAGFMDPAIHWHRPAPVLTCNLFYSRNPARRGKFGRAVPALDDHPPPFAGPVAHFLA
ncbi:MAG: hypothetical protein ACRDL7_04695, partial [Gaiellaceae bacterium]